MYQYLTPDNIFNRYESAKVYSDSLTSMFPEYQRIADNKVKPGHPKHLPANTDGTTSSVVKKTPRRVVQQLPTGKVISAKNDWLNIVAGFIYREKILPGANSQFELIEKCWQSVEGSLIRGYNAIYCPTVHNGDYIGPDWINPWWGDIAIQPGKLSDSDSNYIFLRSWWREEDIDALIHRLGKAEKGEEGGWNVDVLKEIKTHEQTKDDKAQTPTDRAQAVNQRGGIELIIGFQRGVGSQFITFHRETKKIARTKQNKDPRGQLPINFNYCETDGTNPFGRGFVSLVYPLQNLMDSDDQMYQYNRALMLGPPIIKRGTWDKKEAQMRPNAIWDLGSSVNNTAEAVKIDSSALQNYPALYQLNQSRLFQLLSAPNAQIAASTGTLGSSKTPKGVEQTVANLSIDDNYIRKKFEAAFQNWSETAINLWFAEHQGIDQLQLDEKTALQLRTLEGFDPELLSEDNKITINYDDETEALSFRVDASTSQKLSDQEQVANMQAAIPLITPQVSYYLGQDGWKFSLGEFYTNMLTRMNIDNIDKILTKMNEQEAADAKAQPFPIIDPPVIRINSADLTADQLAATLPNAGITVQQPQPGAVAAPPVDPTAPPPGLSPQGMADFFVEMLKAQTDAHIKAAQAQTAADSQQTEQAKAESTIANDHLKTIVDATKAHIEASRPEPAATATKKPQPAGAAK